MAKHNDQVKKVLATLIDNSEDAIKFQQAIESAFNLAFDYSLGFDGAVHSLDVGSDSTVKIDETFISQIKTKFTRLVFVNALIHASGLLSFKDHILSNLIDSMFSSPRMKARKYKEEAS